MYIKDIISFRKKHIVPSSLAAFLSKNTISVCRHFYISPGNGLFNLTPKNLGAASGDLSAEFFTFAP